MNEKQKRHALLILVLVLQVAAISYATLDDGLVAYWSMDGNVLDSSGNGNDGTVHGASLASDRLGNPNSAYSFDGTNDYIDIGSNVKPLFPLTVSLWLKTDSLQSRSLFRNDAVDSRSNRYGLGMYTKSNGHISVAYYEGYSASWNRQTCTTSQVLTYADDQWHHYALVINGHKNLSIYWDGIELATSLDSNASGSGMSYSSSGHGALGHYYSSNGSVYWDGSLDDIRVYNRALSDQEISDLYNAVPEPATLSLLVLGAMLAGRKRSN